jgi:hypothetical protein
MSHRTWAFSELAAAGLAMGVRVGVAPARARRPEGSQRVSQWGASATVKTAPFS